MVRCCSNGIHFQFFLTLIYLLIFWLFWVFITAWDFSSCSEQGLLSSCNAWASHSGGFSCCGAQALGHSGFSNGSTWAQQVHSRAPEHRLNNCGAGA